MAGNTLIDRTQISKHWSLLGVVRAEVRAWAKERCWSRYVGGPEALIHTVESWVAQGFTVAIGINPRLSDIKNAGSDEDVADVRNVVLDIEPDNPKGTLASEAQVETCRAFIQGSIVPYLVNLGLYEPVVAFSGNGFHVWLALPPIPNDGDRKLKHRIRAFLEGVRAAHFAELKKRGLRIDNTSDLSRVIKVYGTKKAELPGARLSRIEGSGQRREDPKLRDYLLALDISDQGGSGTPLPDGLIDLGDFADAEVPAGFYELLKQDPRLELTWKGSRTDMSDNSRSAHDFSLVVQLLRHAQRNEKLVDLVEPETLAAILWQTPYGKVQKLAKDRGGREARRYLEHTIRHAKEEVVAVTGTHDQVFVYPPFTFRADHFAVSDDGTVRTMLTVLKDGKPVHRDRVCLSLAKKRAEFANKCGVDEVDAYLVEIEQKLLVACRTQAALRTQGASAPIAKEISPELRQAAMDFLTDPFLMDRLDEGLRNAGLVGERLAGRLVYLTATSRLLGQPLAVLVMAQSAAGKSFVGDVVISLMPQDQVVDATSCSPQSLAYAGSEFLKHKILRVAENVETDGFETMAYYLRELLSRQRVERLVTVEAEDGGHCTTKAVTEGPIAYIETTTKVRINEENQTRMFVVRIDESLAQTIRIHEAQRRARTMLRFAADRERAAGSSLHHAVQTILGPVNVEVPYASQIEFPTKLRTRRDHKRFLDLIEAIACLHQYQRQSKEVDGQTVIIATIQDYAIAYEIAMEILPDTLGDVPGASRDLHAALVEASNSGKLDRDSFTIGDICGVLDGEMSESVVRRRLKPLLFAELVLLVKEGVGKVGTTYQLGKSAPQARQALLGPGELAVKWAYAKGVFPLTRHRRSTGLSVCASTRAKESKGA